ncbi:MAG TPA: hypothetical protein VNO19_14430 [Gemmatimonadales bacterium]|nr:hypothetical protein [Gemmatimonadales bacterium]
MATRLDKTIKRELELDGKVYTVSVSPAGVKVVPKGGRKGHEISWAALVSGEVQLRRDLNLSLHMYDALRQAD